jgi:ABC-type multidrug transport system ATPase subunit
MALLPKPRLVILDEPTNGLDPHGINQIRETLKRLNREEGVTFLISSHLLHEIEITCNRVGIIKEGRLIIQDTVSNLLAQTIGKVRLEAEPRDVAGRVLQGLGCPPGLEADGQLSFQADRSKFPEIHAALVREGVKVYAFSPARMSLEEFFLSR